MIYNNPLSIRKLFILQSLTYHYNNLRYQFIRNKSITRNKNLVLPKILKTIAAKNSYYVAIELSIIFQMKLRHYSGKKTILKGNSIHIEENDMYM